MSEQNWEVIKDLVENVDQALTRLKKNIDLMSYQPPARHLEAQQETPASGLTSHESGSASQEGTTQSSERTETISAPTSFPSLRGEQLEAKATLPRQPLPSRTTAPTSFTRDTGRSTGPSASTAECDHAWYWNGPIQLTDADLIWAIDLQCRRCGAVKWYDIRPKPDPSPVSAAQPGREKCECWVGWKAKEDRELGAFRTHNWNRRGAHHASTCPLALISRTRKENHEHSLQGHRESSWRIYRHITVSLG